MPPLTERALEIWTEILELGITDRAEIFGRLAEDMGLIVRSYARSVVIDPEHCIKECP